MEMFGKQTMSLNIRDVFCFLRQTLNIKALSDMTVHGQFDIKSSHKQPAVYLL